MGPGNSVLLCSCTPTGSWRRSLYPGVCADAPRGPAPPGSGLRDTPAPCRGSLAQGHTGGPAWEGPARLSVPSGTRSPSAWAGACSPHLHAVRTAPQGMWTRTLQGWSGPGWAPVQPAPPDGAARETQALHPEQSASSPANHSQLWKQLPHETPGWTFGREAVMVLGSRSAPPEPAPLLCGSRRPRGQ